MNNFLLLKKKQNLLESKEYKINLLGSKSIANRYLTLLLCAKEKVSFTNFPNCDDVAFYCSALEILGARINFLNEDKTSVHIDCSNLVLQNTDFLNIYVGAAGTTSRFLTSALSSLDGGKYLIQGTERLHQRPINTLVNCLLELKADIQYSSLGKESLPLLIKGKKLEGNNINVKSNISSQFLSSLLLISPFIKGETVINVLGDFVSSSYVSLTEQTLLDFGLDFEKGIKEHNHLYWRIKGEQKVFKNNLINNEFFIEGDVSSAVYWWVLSILLNQQIKVYGIRFDSIQSDIRSLEVFRQMGCKVHYHEDGAISVEGNLESCSSFEADFTEFPDATMGFAVLAACLKGKSILKGIANLRYKETDRIVALSQELSKLGVFVEYTEDTLQIDGIERKNDNNLPFSTKLPIDTYEDHRMALAFSVLAAVTDNLIINEPQVISKSYPTFWQELELIGFDLNFYE